MGTIIIENLIPKFLKIVFDFQKLIIVSENALTIVLTRAVSWLKVTV